MYKAMNAPAKQQRGTAMLKYEIIDNCKEEWVVFVHGMGGSTKTWAKQIGAFSEFYNLLLLDLPGHGLNADNVIYQVDPDKLHDGIKDTLDHLNISSAHFVGLSLGTLVIADFAICYPDYVETLILGGASLKLKKETMFAWIKYLQITLHPEHILTKLDLLGKRILLISGDEDHCFIDGAKALAKKIRNTELHIIEKCGHICSIEKWNAFNCVALEYLQTYKDSKESSAGICI